MQDAARPVVRVESIISEVIVDLTVKSLAAALSNRSDLNAARSKFGRIVAGLNGTSCTISGFSVMVVPAVPEFVPVSVTREPSKLVLLLTPRVPLTEYNELLFEPVSKPTTCKSGPSGATTPGRIRSNSFALRLMIERFSIWRAEIVFSLAPVSVITKGASVVTVTFSEAIDSGRLTSRPRVALGSRMKCLSSYVLKPLLATRMV